jgi:hypothetical protein
MGGMNWKRPTTIKGTMHHARTSFSTEILAGAMISVVQYLAPLRSAVVASLAKIGPACVKLGASLINLIFLLISLFRSNMTGKSLALSGVGEWLQRGQIRASSVVLESTETHEFSDATYVWIKQARYPNGEPCRRTKGSPFLPGHPSI